MSGGLLEKAKNQDTGSAADEVESVVEEVGVATDGGLLGRANAQSDGGEGMDPAMIKKGVAGSLAVLLVLFIGYQFVMGFTFGGYSISVSDVAVDEDENNLRVQVFIGTPMFKSSPSGDMSMTISYGSGEVWTGSFSVSSKLSWYEVPFADFYKNNSRGAAADGTDIVYSVSVILEGSSSESYPIAGEISDRTIDTVDGELSGVTQICDCEDKNDLDHLGVKFRVGMGALDPVQSNTSNLMMHVDSDYTIEANIIQDSSTVFTFPTVTVNGNAASWSSGSGVVEDSWIDLHGDGSIVDLFGETVYFIPRDSFYGGDGCYSVEITIIHSSIFGDDVVGTSSQGWEFFWDYNEGRTTTGESPDPYKPPEAC